MSDSNRGENNLVQIARSYALDVRPSRAQRQQFSAMMVGHFANLSEKAQVDVANALCLCHHIDLHIASMIARAPLRISSRFLRFSPLFDEAMLSALVMNGDEEFKLCIARRSNLPRSVARMLRDTCDPQINRALDLRQKPRQDLTSAPHTGATLIDKIMTAARSRDLNALCDLLVRRLSISRESAFVILADKSSANLIIALKYCGLDAAQAWETYTLLAPGMAQAEGQKEAFFASFDTYDRDSCASMVKTWILDDLLARVSVPSIANDELGAPLTSTLDDQGGLRKSA